MQTLKKLDYFLLSKSKIFVQKFNFDKILQFFSGNQSSQQLKSANLQHFHEFFNPNFLTIFLVESKLSTAKKSKTAAFSRVFTQSNSTIFLGKSKLNFWTKNEDFGQCDILIRDLLVFATQILWFSRSTQICNWTTVH